MLEDMDSLTAAESENDPLAIMPLLDRFQEVISRYNRDEDSSEPLPRHQASEVSFVLRAVASLAAAMKRASPSRVDAKAWQKLIDVYPELVRLAGGTRICGVGAAGAGAGAALREALLQFGALLAPPSLHAPCPAPL